MKRASKTTKALLVMVLLWITLLFFTFVNSSASQPSGTCPFLKFIRNHLDDFNDNSIDGWTIGSVPATTPGTASVSNGQILLSGPSSSFTSVFIQKSLPLSGDFAVSADFTQQSPDGAAWRHGIFLVVDESNYIYFHDADGPKVWRFGKRVNGVHIDFNFADVGGTAGIEGVPTTLRLEKVGTIYTASIVRNGVETIIGTGSSPEFNSFNFLRLSAWGHGTPFQVLSDNLEFLGSVTCVVFSAFVTNVEITVGSLDNDDAFEMKATFALGIDSDGIDTTTEDVSLKVGTFSTTIPAGSFELDDDGTFKFEGVLADVVLEVEIIPRGGSTFDFKAKGESTDLAGTVIPMAVGLTIGNDSGNTTLKKVEVTAESE